LNQQRDVKWEIFFRLVSLGIFFRRVSSGTLARGILRDPQAVNR